MNDQTNNLIADIQRMFELSLALGNSLDPKKVCDDFSSSLLRLVNLNFIGIWVKPFAPSEDSEIRELYFAYPSSRTKETKLTATHPALYVPEGEDFVSYKLDESENTQCIIETLESGQCAVFRLGTLGFVRLLKGSAEFSKKELRQLRPIINKLSISLEGAISHQLLQKQQAFLQSLVHSIPDLIWLKDVEGHYLACNNKFEDFFGAKEQDIVNKTDFDFVDEELAKFFRENDKKAIEADGPRTNQEWITFANDNREALLETIKTPLKDKEGEVIGVLGVGHDITALHQAQQQLKLSASVFEHATEGIMITDASGVIIDVNNAFTKLTGFTKEEAVGNKPNILKSGYHSDAFFAALWESINSEGLWRGEVRNRNKAGEIFTELLNVAAVKNDQNEITHFVSIFSDITQLKEHQYELEHMAHYDSLTQLPNRVLLSDRLQTAISECVHAEHLLGVAYLDLDDFKPINDRYGHDVGDLLLIDVSKRLLDTLGEECEVARLGGDEFVILLPKLEHITQCEVVLSNTITELSKPFIINGHLLSLSASIGATLFPDDKSDADTLIRHADQAMYTAKQSGRNQYHFFDPEMDRITQNQQKAQWEIREALNEQEFILFYQPKVNLKTGKVVGMEALIRWNHPTRQLLPPDSFLPQITDPNLAADLGEWVLKEAVKQLRVWRSAGMDLSISINISAEHLQNDEFPYQLSQLLSLNPDLPADKIELEVLETAAFDDISIAVEIIRRCQALGVRFALDDFGTGYSSLSYLRKIAVETVKIDKSFVIDMLEDEEDRAIVKGIVGLGKAFDRSIVAEGVETAAHGCLLLNMGCYLAQGYGISKPMPADLVPDWIANFQLSDEWKN
jgi:diguanylate cyclase (GGDEF)-like protein/PAS domain S-box-containing protein